MFYEFLMLLSWGYLRNGLCLGTFSKVAFKIPACSPSQSFTIQICLCVSVTGGCCSGVRGDGGELDREEP